MKNVLEIKTRKMEGKAVVLLFLFSLMITIPSMAQDYDNNSYGDSGNPYPQYNTGLPGDNFSLEGALELFRQSSSPDGFEKALNDQRNYVNNLDLNQDGYIDYVRVRDMMQRSEHAVVLQAVLGPGEVQDIAVIEIEKKNRDEVLIQIVGDEDIYGENVIVEPRSPDYNDAWYGYNNQYKYSGDYFRRRNAYYNSWDWPIIRYIYAPTYVVYSSPWVWHSTPVWYRPWRPYGWNDFYHGCSHYHTNFVIINRPVIINVRNFYEPHRATTVVVQKNYGTKINVYRTERAKYVVSTGKFRIYEAPKSNTARTTANGQTTTAGKDRATTVRTDRSIDTGKQSGARQGSVSSNPVDRPPAVQSQAERRSSSVDRRSSEPGSQTGSSARQQSTSDRLPGKTQSNVPSASSPMTEQKPAMNRTERQMPVEKQNTRAERRTAQREQRATERSERRSESNRKSGSGERSNKAPETRSGTGERM
jgi:hypothetical protein